MSTRRDPPLPFALIALCFFGSGLTALIYQLLWIRRLQLTFGSTTYSVTTVLAAFMAGLGLGSYLVGRRVDRGSGGLRTYAMLELGVGIYALVSLPLLSAVEGLFGSLQSWLQLGQEAAAMLKLLLTLPVLALPAGLMGGTLPALVRGLLRSRTALPGTVGRLYGINTAGAALGTVVAGALIIELLGLWRGVVLAALINLSIGIFVLERLRGRTEPARDEKDDARQRIQLGPHLRRAPVLFCAVAVALTGLLSMLYEIVWTRVLSLMVGSSTYAFTIVLATFLVGIAGGALVYARLSRRRPPTAFGLTLVLLALALWVMISLVVIPAIPWLLINLAQIPGVSFLRVLLFQLLLALVVLLVPTLLLGAALPMSMGIISRSVGQVGADVGAVYLVNTLGAIVGSVLTGFVLIPLVGTQNSLLLGLGANLLLVGVGVVAFGGTRRLRALGATVVLLLGVVALSQPRWPPEVFDAGIGFRLDECHATNKLELYRSLHRAPNRLLSRVEGRNATVSVRHFTRGVSLLINGKPDASTSGDMLTQVVLGILATASHPRPRDVAVVGWGSGVTTHTVTFFPEVERIDAIEIEPAVVRASPYFHGVNGRVERHPKVRVVHDDARSYLLTTSRSYDLIISEPSNPWMSGVSALFSREHYELARRRMRPGGVFGQWLQLYRMDARSVALVLRTMHHVFADVQVWASDPYNIILLGSDRPIRCTHARVSEAYRRSAPLRQHMAIYGPGIRPGHLFGCFLLDRNGVASIIKRFPNELMTDDRPILEYRALRSLYRTNRRHIEALIDAKLRLGQVVPPRSGAPPGLALAGAATILSSVPELSGRITEWAMQRHSTEPELLLARARALVQLGQLSEARVLTGRLPRTPAMQGEAALLEGRILHRQGDFVGALRRLDDMGRLRPTVKLAHQLDAALAASRWDLGWTLAERLVARFSVAGDIDARRLLRFRVYRQILVLTEQSGAHDRAIRLLSRRRERYDGEIDRLWALANAYWWAKRPRQAASTLDQVLEFNYIDERSLRLCVKVYGAVKDRRRVRRCHRMLIAADLEPQDRPLFE